MRNFLFIVGALLLLSSCSATHKTMKEPTSRVEFTKADFSLSNQVSAEAHSTRILNIDWERLFGAKTGGVEGGSMALPSIASIPVIGGFVTDKTQGYALYELMQANPGYDVVFYPQYETTVERPIILGFLYRKTTVKVNARLGKL